MTTPIAVDDIEALVFGAWILAIRYGMRDGGVAAGPPVFLRRKGLDHVGPRAFGYDLDFRSVFEAQPRRRSGISA